jgi:hypothetical protein
MSYVIQCEGVTICIKHTVREALHEARKLLEQGMAAHVFPWTDSANWKEA